MAIAVIPYSFEVYRDGGMRVVSVPALATPQCSACGQVVLDGEACRVIEEAVLIQAQPDVE